MKKINKLFLNFENLGVPKLVRGEVWHLLMIQQQMFHQTPRQKNVYPPFFHTQYEDMLKELTSQQHAILIDLGKCKVFFFITVMECYVCLFVCLHAITTATFKSI